MDRAQEYQRERNVDNIIVMYGMQEEMIKKIDEKQVKLSITEGLFMTLQVTSRGTNQYDANVQRLYGMTKNQTVGTQSQIRNDARRNPSKAPNSGGNLHVTDSQAQSKNGENKNLLIEDHDSGTGKTIRTEAKEGNLK